MNDETTKAIKFDKQRLEEVHRLLKMILIAESINKEGGVVEKINELEKIAGFLTSNQWTPEYRVNFIAWLIELVKSNSPK